MHREQIQRATDGQCAEIERLCDTLLYAGFSSTSSPQGSGNSRRSRKTVEPLGIEGTKKTMLSKHKRTGKEEPTKIKYPYIKTRN